MDLYCRLARAGGMSKARLLLRLRGSAERAGSILGGQREHYTRTACFLAIRNNNLQKDIRKAEENSKPAAPGLLPPVAALRQT